LDGGEILQIQNGNSGGLEFDPLLKYLKPQNYSKCPDCYYYQCC